MEAFRNSVSAAIDYASFVVFAMDWVVDARSTHLERLLKVSDSRSEDSQ